MDKAKVFQERLYFVKRYWDKIHLIKEYKIDSEKYGHKLFTLFLCSKKDRKYVYIVKESYEPVHGNYRYEDAMTIPNHLFRDFINTLIEVDDMIKSKDWDI